MSKKLTYEFVKEQFEKEKYILLSANYKDTYTYLKFICPNKHQHKITWNSWSKGTRCRYCYFDKNRMNINNIKKVFEDENYILLTNTYKNSSTKLTTLCPNNHRYETTWGNWYNGVRCKICVRKELEKRFVGEGNPNWKGGRLVCPYNTYADQIEYAEEIRQSPNDNKLIEVKCTYCGKWYLPTVTSVRSRVEALNSSLKTKMGEHRFYCSNNCKKACPIFKQKIYPKGFKKATSREVQPELRRIVLARDSYQCQICHKDQTEVELHCHHITGVVQNPLESADIDNCITLCKEHHKEVHKLPGCNYNDLKCSN